MVIIRATIALMVVLNLAYLFGTGSKQTLADCPARCIANAYCMTSSNTICPLCNAIGGTGCTNYKARTFNPAGAAIQSTDDTGNQTRSSTPAVCYTDVPCADGGAIPFQACWGGGFGGCGAPVPLPYGCWPCLTIGTKVNFVVDNWVCSTCPS